MKRLLDYDPVTGVSCYMEHRGSQLVVTHEQDVQPILDANKRAQNDADKTKRGMKQDWWKFASVPAVVEIEWLQKYGVRLDDPNHAKKVFELLNSPEYKYLKSTTKIHTVKD